LGIGAKIQLVGEIFKSDQFKGIVVAMITAAVFDDARQVVVVELPLVARKVMLLHANAKFAVVRHLVAGASPCKTSEVKGPIAILEVESP